MSTTEYPLKIIFDTSIYIPFINKGLEYPVVSERHARPVLYMSAVVLEELYAGAYDNRTKKLLDKLYKTFTKVGRFVVPEGSDWQKTGKIIAKLGEKYGFETRYLSKLQNDILISLSARRIGAFIVTQNAKDFLRLKEFVNFKVLE